MKSKIIRIPVSRSEREHNIHGTGYVPCNVSDRWLQFSDTYDKELNLVFADVMTLDHNEKPKKICTLCLDVNELKAELAKIKPE